LDTDALTQLIERPEGPSLDWKQDFPNELRAPRGQGVWDIGRAKLLRSLVAIANAAEDCSGYLVYGVEDRGDDRIVRGISGHFDDADFQEWAKNVFDPSPSFLYSEIQFSDTKTVGLFEISRDPAFPHVCAANLGNALHKGQVWHRRGSQNEVALRQILKDMFSGPDSFKIPSCGDPKARDLVQHYKNLGFEPAWPTLHERDVKLDEGYRIAFLPGTRREVWAGLGRFNEWEHILMLKP